MTRKRHKRFSIDTRTTMQLVKYLNKEYISYEFYPLVRVMLKRANKFLSTIDNEFSDRTDGLNGRS